MFIQIPTVQLRRFLSFFFFFFSRKAIISLAIFPKLV